MEDYLIREIDRIGDILVQIARRLGLVGGQQESIPIENLKSEFSVSGLDLDIDEVLHQDAPVLWLIEQKHLSDKALETFTDILMYSDIDMGTKKSFLNESVSYLDGKGCFSFMLHSYMVP